jgi:hypothetical protein
MLQLRLPLKAEAHPEPFILRSAAADLSEASSSYPALLSQKDLLDADILVFFSARPCSAAFGRPTNERLNLCAK